MVKARWRKIVYLLPIFPLFLESKAIPRADANITMVHFMSWTSTPVGKPGIVWIRGNLHSYMVLIIHAIPLRTGKTIVIADPNILNLD
jgi:hypothetical protein